MWLCRQWLELTEVDGRGWATTGSPVRRRDAPSSDTGPFLTLSPPPYATIKSPELGVRLSSPPPLHLQGQEQAGQLLLITFLCGPRAKNIFCIF